METRDRERELERELSKLRAEYQRLETKHFIVRQQLVSVLWCNGPQMIPKSSAMVPTDVHINETASGDNLRLSVTMTHKRRAI